MNYIVIWLFWGGGGGCVVVGWLFRWRLVIVNMVGYSWVFLTTFYHRWKLWIVFVFIFLFLFWDDGSRKIRKHPARPKASNPYHECDEFCLKRVAGAEVQRDKEKTSFFACLRALAATSLNLILFPKCWENS